MAAMNKRRKKKALKKDLRKLQRLLDNMAQEYKAAGQINQREVADYLAETEYFKHKLEITRAAVKEMEARKCK